MTLRRLLPLAVAASLWLAALAPPAPAQEPARPQASGVTIPNYWDPRRRPERPNLGGLRTLRFLTESDYPPFNFVSADGALVGFNVELARAICVELNLSCTIQPRSWETLIPALKAKEGDAVIAGMAITKDARRDVEFSDRYLQNPARFATRTDNPVDPSADLLAGKRVAVVRGTAHEAFLREQFKSAVVAPFADLDEARRALKGGQVDALLADGVNLSVWLNGEDAAGCCRFVGGPYTESFYFGEGIAIAIRKDDTTLRLALDYALARLYERGVYAELYLRYFPIGFF
ncbi:MAG: transporter substrate-binding domain-containing protein [Pseudomonadota bacterium]|nr:transporter substrate-binding domain-containing protein [Pseudomonadota bacterium]